LPKDQKRISTYLSVQFKYKLDELLAQLEWSESEYVKRAIEEYFPKAIQLRDALMEKRHCLGGAGTTTN
jgi:predicted DNA-binding protein